MTSLEHIIDRRNFLLGSVAAALLPMAPAPRLETFTQWLNASRKDREAGLQACLDRIQAHKIPMVATLGRHVNDEMISFYVQTPGGFALEYGVGGKRVDWKDHIVFETTRGSDWGHNWVS